MKTKLSKFLYISAVAAFICGLVFWIVSIQQGWLRFSFSEVKITALDVCSEYELKTQKPNQIANQISYGTENFFLCGNIETSAPIDFAVYIYKTAEERAFMSQGLYRIEQGFFYREISLPRDLLPGEYRVDAYFRRETIATTNFVILDP